MEITINETKEDTSVVEINLALSFISDNMKLFLEHIEASGHDDPKIAAFEICSTLALIDSQIETFLELDAAPKMYAGEV